MRKSAKAVLSGLVLLTVPALVGGLALGLIRTGPGSVREVRAARRTLSFSGTAAQTFDRPMASVFGRGKLYVAEGSRAKITALNRDGAFLYSFNSRPNGPKLRKGYPTGLALGPKNRLYVADLLNEDVWVFNTKGRFLWSLKGRGAGFGRPGTVAFARGKLYLSDLTDQTIKEFTASGKLSAVYGGPGSGRGRFAYVTGIAVGPRGRIFVADTYNRRVQVLSQRGKFVKILAPRPGFNYALPRALTVDAKGRVYVLDTFKKVGSVFDRSGKYLSSFRADKDLSAMPNSIAVDDRGHRIFVTDKLLGTVSMWGLPR